MSTESGSPHAPQTAILIGQPELCRRLERQLDLLDHRPVTVGWIIASSNGHAWDTTEEGPILGTIDQMESVIASRLNGSPEVALISLPAVMKDLVASIRTRLRKIGLPDRFIATLEDQVAGVGPRTHLEIDLEALLDRPSRRIDENAVREVIEGQRVLITGAGGSIGGELARIVARFRPRLLALIDRSENALFEIDRQIARRHPQLPRRALLHDVVDAAATLAHFHELRPHVIFHAAAHKHVPIMEDHPAAAIDNNLFGTKSVADAADAVAAQRFVMISTDKAVNPRSIMGATKRLAELYVQSINQGSGTRFSIVRFGNVLGSSGSVLDTWSRQIADGGPLTVTDPRMTRYFMTIPEAAALVIQSAALVSLESGAGEVFLLDMGEPIRIIDLARRFAEQHGLEARLPDKPEARTGPSCIDVVFSGVRPGEKLFEDLVFDGEAMRPTRHPDIHIWELPPPECRYVEQLIAQLSPERRGHDVPELAAEIRRLVAQSCEAIAV
jgi:FlaA1/EpsC-like NDP-sugar epimerase